MIALVAGPCKPPRSVQGLGLPYLAAVLEQAGFGAKIFDLYPPSPDTNDPAVLDARLADVIAGEQPSIVGITIHTPAYAERVRLAKRLRERLPEALLVAGGHHPTAEPEHLLQNSEFDMCVIGEGEGTLLEIARHVEKKESRRPDDWLRNVRGVVYKQEDGVLRTPPRPLLADLDSLPLQAHHLLGLENYAPHPNIGVKSTGIVTYRGCPMGCVFCMNPQGPHVRKRGPAKVVDEMARVGKELGVRGFNFYDNLFGLDHAHSSTVCEEMIRRGLAVTWDCWSAGDLVDDRLAHRMKAAGCVRVGFGAESGDDAVLERSGRGFTTAQHLQGIRCLQAAGLKVTPFFMIGLPGESKESVQRTVEFAKRCGTEEVCLGVHRPYPGTAVWRNPEAFGVRVVRGPNFEAYIETECLSRPAILDCAQRATEDLRRGGAMKVDVLRCDRYAWE